MARRVVISPATKQVLSRWYDKSLIDETPVFQGSFLGWLFGLFNQHAVTVDGRVHITNRVDYAPDSPRGAVLLGHELFHVQQQRDMNWRRFLMRYIVAWRPYHVSRGWEHPMERPAYDRGREISGYIASSKQVWP